MSDQSRKLLPYEYQLVDALGITKEEYLDFVAQQHIYKDAKEGTVLDARNWEAVAIVLTVIGVLFQVAAVLLAPKPQESKGRPGTREEIFSPRFGFNSVQELAKYGDPVNLIYTNTTTNTSGGVRVATSLLWSAIQSYGNSQFIMLMFLIGAGGIGAIDQKRSAFGQIGMRDLVAQNYWLYFDPDDTGFLQYQDILSDPYGQKKLKDPSKVGGDADNPYRIRRKDSSTMAQGFSHAYSPASSNTFGIYGVVPVNVDILVRNEKGDFKESNNLISSSIWRTGKTISVGDKVTLVVKQADEDDLKEGSLASREAAESRQSLVSVFDSSGIIKLGSAHLKITSISASDIINSDMKVSLECVKSGKGSTVNYNATNSDAVDVLFASGQAEEYKLAETKVKALLAEDERRVLDYRRLIKSGYQDVYRNLNAEELLEEGDIWVQDPKKIAYSVIFKRKLTKTEISYLKTYLKLTEVKTEAEFADDYFYVKAVSRIEEASYETISPCHIVDFSIKSRVYKRVSGRAEEYGSKRREGWSSADNGVKTRSAMFILKYKKASDSGYSYVQGIFVVRRAADIDNYNFIRFNSGKQGESTASHWQFVFEPIFDPQSEVSAHSSLKRSDGKLRYHYLSSSSSSSGASLSQISLTGDAFIEFAGRSRDASSQFFPPLNTNPGGMNEWDIFANSSDNQVQFSFDNGPEFTLAAVTEQIIDPASNYPKLYQDLSLIGLNMYSGKTVQDLRSFSLFVTKGRKTRSLRTSGKDQNNKEWGTAGYDYLTTLENGNYANTAPDIFVDTVLDNNDGIGQYASVHSIDLEQLAKSKKFCEKNNLFMDGVIADPTSWREFWATNAGFSLLELAKVGGKDALVPAIPYNKTTGEATTSIPIVALFNQGNILEGSYKEEFIDYGSNTQDVIVTAIYRKPEQEGLFSLKGSVDVQLADTKGSEENCLKETIDMSTFVTRKDQAIKVAKFLCLTRRYSRRSIEFKTFPTDSPVFPGAYVYVELAQNKWDKVYTGIIEESGYLNLASGQSIPNGSYSVLCYKPGGNGTSSLSNVAIASNKSSALSSYKDHLFVLGEGIRNKRVFRVTEVAMDEEGEVTIRGVEHDTDGSGNSLIARGITSKITGLFLIDGSAE